MIELRSPNIPDSGDYDPWKHRNVKDANSDCATFFNLLKASVGTGVLTLPICFFRAGLIPGLIYALAVTLLTLYCMTILIRTQYYVAKRNRIPYATYGFTMNECFSNGPAFFKKIGNLGEVFVDVFIVLFHLGTLTVYITFIAHTVIEVFGLTDIPIRLMQVYVTFPLLIVINISNLKAMAFTSAIGALIQMVCFSSLFYFIFRSDEYGFRGLENTRYYGSIAEGPIMIGAMLFGIQTLGVLLSLDENMKNPAHLLGVCGIFPVTMIFIVTFYMFVGIIGYLKYGSEIQGSISLNIPSEDVMSKGIKFGFALTVVCSFPIQVFPAVLIFWKKYTQPKIDRDHNPCNIIEITIRTTICFLCLGLACVIPQVDIIASLVGSLTVSALGVLFPALGHYLLLWNERGGKISLIMVFDIFVMIIGLLLAGITTYSSIISAE